jgi:hypothetical protein
MITGQNAIIHLPQIYLLIIKIRLQEQECHIVNIIKIMLTNKK